MTLKGSDFIAVSRIHAGDEIFADVDETCERVPPSALAGLEARGAIVRTPVDLEAKPARKRKADAAPEHGKEGG